MQLEDKCFALLNDDAQLNGMAATLPSDRAPNFKQLSELKDDYKLH